MAGDESTLRLAGVGRATGLIPALRETERTVLVVLAAGFLVKIYARCERPDHADKLTLAGAEHIILPPRLRGTHLGRHRRGPPGHERLGKNLDLARRA